MIIYSILNGKGKIEYTLNNEKKEVLIQKGETVLIPVGINIELIGELEILRTIIE